MNREDFWHDKRKERKIDFLADYRVVSKYIQKKHKLHRADFEMLLKMHSLGTFLKKEFDSAQSVFPWNTHRWQKMLDGEWIKRYRKKAKGRNYNIYTVTQKTKNIVEECYKVLCGEKTIPETPRFNPIMYEKSYSDVKYAEAIRMFNKARENI